MEYVSPKHSTPHVSKELPGRLLFQSVKLPSHFQDAKRKMKMSSLSMYTLLQKASGLQDIDTPPKRK